MSPRRHRPWVFLLLGLLFILRLDLWWWSEPRLLMGMPIGLAYHLFFCLLVVFVMAFIVRFASLPELGPSELGSPDLTPQAEQLGSQKRGGEPGA